MDGVCLLRKTAPYFLKKLNIKLLCNATMPLLSIHSNELKKDVTKQNRSLKTKVHGNNIHKRQKALRAQLSINRSMDKQNVIYTMGCYSALKKNDTVTHATTWVNTEDIKLNIR